MGRPKRTLFDEMRAAAWVKELESLTGWTPNGLREFMVKKGERDIRFDRYLFGGTTPDQAVLTAVHQDLQLAPAEAVHSIGPVEDGEHVPLWLVFEDRYDEFWSVIGEVIPLRPYGDTHAGRIDQLAEKFIVASKWKALTEEGSFGFTLEDVSNNSTSGFKARLIVLAAVIAMWRFSMLLRERVAESECLVHWLLAEPYRDLLKKHKIYEQLCTLVRAYAVDYYSSTNDLQAACEVFEHLPLAEIREPKQKKDEADDVVGTVYRLSNKTRSKK